MNYSFRSEGSSFLSSVDECRNYRCDNRLEAKYPVEETSSPISSAGVWCTRPRLPPSSSAINSNWPTLVRASWFVFRVRQTTARGFFFSPCFSIFFYSIAIVYIFKFRALLPELLFFKKLFFSFASVCSYRQHNFHWTVRVSFLTHHVIKLLKSIQDTSI
jgi:hypothetical protein